MNWIKKKMKFWSCRPVALPSEAPKSSGDPGRENAIQDLFVPRPSRLSVRYCHQGVLPHGHDVWIEGRYKSSTTGESIPYFWSVQTGEYCKGDPPTGSRKCITLHEIKDQSTAVQIRAQQRIAPSKDTIRGMPAPRPNMELVHAVLAGHAPEQKKDRTASATDQSSTDEKLSKETSN